MILRRHLNITLLSTLYVLLLFASRFVLAQDDSSETFDCKNIIVGDLKFDLSALAGEHSISRERETPPTKWRDTLRFNLCANLKEEDGVDADQQCPSETRACLTKTNLKGSQESWRTSIIPLANSTVKDMELSSIPSPSKGISVTFKGPSYPSPITSELIPQSFIIKVLCTTDTSDPKFISYDGKDAHVEWSASAGCGFSSPPGSPQNPDSGSGDEKEAETVGSGIGYFFLLLLLAFVVYFGLGAYYNYSTYGASGADLIPHRDFWREVPYMLRDVVSHLCATIRPRQSANRGGYIAV